MLTKKNGTEEAGKYTPPYPLLSIRPSFQLKPKPRTVSAEVVTRGSGQAHDQTERAA